MFLRHRPSGPLALYVDCLWYSERGALPHTRERSLPTGCADIVVPLLQDHLIRYDTEQLTHARRLRGAVVQGASDRFGVRGTEGASAVIGVHFRAGGAVAFLGGALPELRNRTELLEDVWGPAARELRETLQAAGSPRGALQLLRAQLLQRLRDAAPPDPLVAAAIDAFRLDPARARVEPVRHDSGCTPAQFIRRFEQAVGLTPKRYARVLRFGVLLPSLARCGPRDWAQIAVGAGYYDQSHLIHEFRALAGMAPGAYVPVQADQPTHVALGP
ncbi:helix-turn-helix domain-containing protein [Aquabacterium sp. A7-Y]|uniref:helix-turn-helix domain-containing protein n=1 Tax=Aquabacterium sp. A7-Y TaxID=1349605 RepID=UPI00223D7D48|nr:helix-turn-helix domain-containing protein [Aquabacterium sp. A7-Y]MCW7541772.1 helix-turn-helix domain-containing protein [Aquabacterium sp. A7-Y]